MRIGFRTLSLSRERERENGMNLLLSSDPAALFAFLANVRVLPDSRWSRGSIQERPECLKLFASSRLASVRGDDDDAAASEELRVGSTLATKRRLSREALDHFGYT